MPHWPETIMQKVMNINPETRSTRTGVYFHKDTLERSGRYVSALEHSLKSTNGLGVPFSIENATAPSPNSRVAPSLEALGVSLKEHVHDDIRVQTVPIQIWEGRVTSVNHQKQSMEVFLSSTLGGYDAHTGEIDLQWVSDQDKDLVVPGAVFYLTLFKRSKRGTVENSQELRFRRQPNWTKDQLKRISDSADTLLKKMGTPRALYD
jgi:frataxin-like iron-binding protein CyaY